MTDARPETVSTHISMLVLTGDRVFKFRKPVATDFCDFTTAAARLHDCEREVALNRRLTDDVYLGVGRVQLDGDDPSGRDPEPCVVMRRLPRERLLSTLIDSGADIDEAVRAVAARLVAFHATAERSPEIDAGGLQPAVAARWAGAVEQLRPFTHTATDVARLDEIARLATRWSAGRAVLFTERAAAGLVCDGHGDLRADNIFSLEDGPRILDCLEFDDSLRHLDVVTDLAFLVMDLRRLGRPAEAEVLIAEHEAHSEHSVPRGLLDHDVAYWALVRAKVAHLRGAGDDSAEQLMVIALEHLVRARVQLVLVGGLPGTGKSTLARALSAATGWPVLSTDLVRKELAQLPDGARTHDGFGSGLYDPARTAATYDEVLHRARQILERGESVIVDASWNSASQRAAAVAMADEAHAELHEVRCVVDAEVARRRIEARLQAGDDASDADVAIAERMARSADPWPSATPVDTSASPAETAAALVALLGDSSPPPPTSPPPPNVGADVPATGTNRATSG